MQMAFEAIFGIIRTMHKLRGSSTISLDLNDFIEYIVALIVLSSITKKGEIVNVFGPLSGF